MRRAAVSVPSNISESLTSRTDADKIHFLNISDGSLSEIDTQLEIALKLKFIVTTKFEVVKNKLVLVQKLQSGLVRSFKKVNHENTLSTIHCSL